MAELAASSALAATVILDALNLDEGQQVALTNRVLVESVAVNRNVGRHRPLHVRHRHNMERARRLRDDQVRCDDDGRVLEPGW
jgi:hypothetical protein